MKQEPAGENAFRSTLGVLAGIAGAIALAAGLNTALSAGKTPRDMVDEQFDDSASGPVIRERFTSNYEAGLAAIPADHALGLNERSRQSATRRTRCPAPAFSRKDQTSSILRPITLLKKMDEVFAALMAAIAEGRDRPVSRKAVYAADWTALNDAVRATGVAQQQLDALEDESVHEEDCRAAIAYFETPATLPGEAGERVRSYSVDVMASLT